MFIRYAGLLQRAFKRPRFGARVQYYPAGCQFNDIADHDGFLVVYPAGKGDSWNSGEKGPGFAIANDIDDIAFVKEILSDLETMFNLDPERIYAMGFSLGGAMAYRLACDMSDTFAAVASVAK